MLLDRKVGMAEAIGTGFVAVINRDRHVLSMHRKARSREAIGAELEVPRQLPASSLDRLRSIDEAGDDMEGCRDIARCLGGCSYPDDAEVLTVMARMEAGEALDRGVRRHRARRGGWWGLCAQPRSANGSRRASATPPSPPISVRRRWSSLPPIRRASR
jgi:hypothetical protein